MSYKRSKKTVCANPIFEKWIDEWRDDAAAKDLQSKHTFAKCLNSLRKYPLPLKTGRECIILEGFGDKICKQIDEKLKIFLDEGGVLHEDDDIIDLNSDCDTNSNDNEIIISDSSERSSSIVDKYKKPKNAPISDNITKKKITQSKNILEDNDSELDDDLVSLDVPSGSKSSSSSTLLKQINVNSDKRCESESVKNKSKSKEYLPEPRSGPYALLITLLKNESKTEDESLHYMLKNDLIEEAQKHCDSSFKPKDHNARYCAWNSMSTLIKRDLAIKENKLPARYRLTESGRTLAKRLLYGIMPDEPSDEDSENVIDEPKIDKPNKDRSGPKTTKKTVENVPVEQNQRKNYRSPEKPSNIQSNFIEINDIDSDDSDIIDLSQEPVKKSIPVKVSRKSSSLDEDCLPDLGVGEGIRNKNSNSNKSNDIVNMYKKAKTNNNKPDEITAATSFKPTSQTTLTQQFGQNKISSQNSTTSLQTIETYPAGSFNIILYVDNCEQSHAKKQEILMDELKKSKINFEYGKLNIGDFTWIARPKNAVDNKKDIVLNYIVERKRTDDLCASIIDGRYKEQKFRLKKCGISNIIYLIEDYGSIKHLSLPEKSILQADVNTQLIDNFMVHHTTDPKDSAHYLIEFTKYLTITHKNLTLKACPKESIDSYYKESISQKSIRTNLMTFHEFNQFSNKNKPLTIREMFAKCLMRIQGLSMEKCISIVELYPSPSIFIRELSNMKDEAARVKAIANLKYGKLQRNIGPALAKIIVQLFHSNGPLN